MSFTDRTTTRPHRFLRPAAVSILASAVLLSGLATAASATTVDFTSTDLSDGEGGDGGDPDAIRYLVSGERGESNSITAEFTDGRITIRDRNAEISSEEGCSRRSSHEVRCSVSSSRDRYSLAIDGGDGNDGITVSLGAVNVNIDPGTGRDTIRFKPRRTRRTDVSVELQDGEADHVSCSDSERVRLHIRSRDAVDDIDDCPSRRR